MADLTQATRELFIRPLINEVHMKTPLIEALQKRNQVIVTGGLYLERLVSKDTLVSLFQAYSTNEALQDSKKDMLAKPRFYWKKGQLPLRYDVDEETENISGGREEQLLNLADFLASQGHDACREYMCQRIFNTGSTTSTTDTDKKFNSLVDALNHDATYGTIARTLSSATNSWWQGADPTGLTSAVTSSSQDTAYNLTISNLRQFIHETDVSHYMESENDLECYMCPTLFNKLRAEAEAKIDYTPNQTQEQFLTKAKIDNVTCVSVPYLQTTSTMKTWLFIVNLKYWNLYYHRDRNFKVTPFKWQGDISGGYDRMLARILVKGNLVCWKCNSSMWLSNVS